jgi:hypothetical protein
MTRMNKHQNPTNGSWWIVQVLATEQHSSSLTLRAENDPRFRKLAGTPREASRLLSDRLRRLDLNHPLTAVSGIRKVLDGAPYRLDLNMSPHCRAWDFGLL